MTYNGSGARAKLRFKDLEKTKRLRLFVSFQNQEVHDTFSPVLRQLPRVPHQREEEAAGHQLGGRTRRAFDGYTREKCRGIKVKADYDKDLLVYKLPGRCAGYLQNVGYIDSYASARKFKPSHWDEGSPANSTGDWFDTTYGLHVERLAECSGAGIGFRTGMTLARRVRAQHRPSGCATRSRSTRPPTASAPTSCAATRSGRSW